MTIHSIYTQLFKIWRVKRFNKFIELLQPNRKMSLLDVGGYPWTWTVHPPVVGSITCINIHPVDWDPASALDHNIRTVVGDGCELKFEDNSFDIVFSNSVIEHVGSLEKQQAFAKECQRVGKNLWIQTPARECPIEPHYLAPFVHWMTPDTQRKLLRHFTPWGLFEKPSASAIEEIIAKTHLLSIEEWSMLFYDCSIYKENLIGLFPKSYSAYRITS